MIPPESLVLLDTNVVVHLARGNATGRALDERYQLRSRRERPLICVVTVGELLTLARGWRWSQEKIDALKGLCRDMVVVDIAREPILARYADLMDHGRSSGRPLGENDAWIAAAASVTGAHLLTLDQGLRFIPSDLAKVECVDQEGLSR